ncbi:unnamed protein product [Paramecium octaurelia]|uniref:Uncharacterized protein n=1 Tax=Paramecium octaurelia TaxID=43137 RepID=A0A8S1WX04_PAROT|nr:unnamed protein product [Paramecium octaurelia]
MLLCFRLWSFDKMLQLMFQIIAILHLIFFQFFQNYIQQNIFFIVMERSSFFQNQYQQSQHMLASPPRGGVNKGQILPLKCSCPPDCQCKSVEKREWHHKPCSEQSYISQYGDIFCRHHLTKCKGYFIKDASFQCAAAQQANTWNQYRNASQFLMAIAQGLQAAEITLDANDLVNFAACLNTEVIRRWNQ